ncbi:MAG: hypothetical protein N2C14_20595, partial [Planctomycetales bacterium]
IHVPIADTITSWRVTASAVSSAGKLGGLNASIRVFQPFFVEMTLPVALTRGDEVSVPVVVHNYLDSEQTVALSLDKADWFELLDEETKQLTIPSNDAKSVYFRVKATQVGRRRLQATARGTEFSDAVQREIEVVPDGRLVEHTFNGTLDAPVRIPVRVPGEAIEGSAKLLVKLYPSAFSQLVEGLDGIFQQPHGCFEQASSTTYPNVLALDYMIRSKQAIPAVEAKARQYIHLGYQRLIGFEVGKSGGFDWYGNPPANRTLTAYGLMEFQDMNQVHDVDENLIARTRRWLLNQRKVDGHWEPEGHGFGGGPSYGAKNIDVARLSVTAYIAWAVFGDQSQHGSQITRDYLLAYPASDLDDPYVVAVVANALLAMDPAGNDAAGHLKRLEELKQVSEDGKQAWWTQPDGSRTMFYGAGQAGSVEATAMAVLAQTVSNHSPGTARQGLTWLTAHRDGRGTWGTTQATVLALKALLSASGKPLGDGQARRIEIALMEGQADLVRKIPADQTEVMQLIDLSEFVRPGQDVLTLTDATKTGTGYQAVLQYHVPENAARPEELRPTLSIDVAYDRQELQVNEVVSAVATLTNNLDEPAPMVIVDLPIPAGFTLQAGDLEKLVREKKIAKYQLNARSAVIYLRGLPASATLRLPYRLKATMPVDIQIPAA